MVEDRVASRFGVHVTLAKRVCREVCAKYGMEIPHMYGTMIEIPRAALTADKIAGTAEFFSFGTTDRE